MTATSIPLPVPAGQAARNATPRADMRWLAGFVLKRPGYSLGAVVAGIIGGITGAAEPFLIGLIIDHVQDALTPNAVFGATGQFAWGADTSIIARDALLILIFAVITVAAYYAQRYFSGQVAYMISFDIRRHLFDNLLALDQSFYAHYATGDLLSRMHSDMDMVWRLFAIGFLRFSGSVTSLIVTFVLLASVNLTLTAVVFIVLTVSTIFQFWAGAKLAPEFEKVQEQGGVLAARVQDAFSGIGTVKTFGAEPAFNTRYADANTVYRTQWLTFKRRNEPVGMLPNMISQLTTGVVVLFGGILTVNGQMTLGNFAQFLIYLGIISTVLLNLGVIYQRAQQTRGALFRFTPLLQPPAIADAEAAKPGIAQSRRLDIRFEDVSLTLDDAPVLEHISLHIPAGRVVGIVGATGSGKTMLVSLLARLYDPTSGRVLVNGKDARLWSLDELRAAIAYVPQTTFLFSRTLGENVKMGRESLTLNDLEQAIHISRVSNDLPQLPLGLETLVGEKGVMLSGGQKQRVAIARAIARDPAILILDDALSSVDTSTAADILGDLRQILRSRTSIILAHRMATVKDADDIIVMEEGRIAEQGSYQQLVERGGLFARMVSREMAQDSAAGQDLDVALGVVERQEERA